MSKNNTVFVSGIFNVLHPGHFRFLRFAKEQGQKLMVGVFADSMVPEATITQDERLRNISTLSFVDESFLLEETVEEYLSKKKPDVVVKGWEHHNRVNPEKDVIENYGGRLLFSSGDIKFSESREPGNYAHTIAKPPKFMEHHNFSFGKLLDLIKKFSSVRVCIIGDIIVDHYTDCQAVGMSREDPTIVVRPVESKRFVGGAGIVASHAKSLGANCVHLISVSGADEASNYCCQIFDETGIEHHIFKESSRPTTQKRRFRTRGKTLLRVNDYTDHPASMEIAHKMLNRLKEIIADIDLLIFSDFSYGALPQDFIRDVGDILGKKNIITAADSQSSSQIGDISRFKNLSLITPTEHEARLALNNFSDGLVQIGDKIQEKTQSRNVVVTLGEEGIFIKSANENGRRGSNDRLPAFQSTAKDVAGAGDAFLISSSMALAVGASIWEAAYIGSMASAIQVSRTGNIPLKNNELREALQL